MKSWSDIKDYCSLIEVEFLIIFANTTNNIIALIVEKLYYVDLYANNIDSSSYNINKVTKRDMDSCIQFEIIFI